MNLDSSIPRGYWGFAAIATRMGWHSIKPLYRHIRRYAFPAYKRVDPRNRFRVMWFSHEGLILRWELMMAQSERERLMAKKPDGVRRLIRPAAVEKKAGLTGREA